MYQQDKFMHNWAKRGPVINDLANFNCSFLGGGGRYHKDEFSELGEPNYRIYQI